MWLPVMMVSMPPEVPLTEQIREHRAPEEMALIRAAEDREESVVLHLQAQKVLQEAVSMQFISTAEI